jgi:Protein RETICULATA-related
MLHDGRAHSAALHPGHDELWHARVGDQEADSLLESGGGDVLGGSSSSGGAAGSGGGHSGGGGGGDGASSEDDSLPADVQQALAAGVLSAEALARYRSYALGGNPLMRLLVAVPSFRTRVLADAGFVFKLLAQELIGNGTALASEFAVRGKDIVNELEYVVSDVIVGTVVEAAFVWLLAPRMAGAVASATATAGARSSGLASLLNSLPANAFEASTAARSFSLQLRVLSFVYAGLQYAAIGMVAGVVGTAITYGLLETRKAFDASYVPDRPMPPIFSNSVAWAAFMGLSSNTRFQAVEGIERVLPLVMRGSSVADSALKFSVVALRFGNNYWGGVQFIQFMRFLGLHATGEEEH